MRERAALTKSRQLALAAWGLAMGVVTVLALLPIEHLQLPVFDWWGKAQHALAFVVLTGWALLLWPYAPMRVALSMMAYGAGLELAQWAGAGVSPNGRIWLQTPSVSLWLGVWFGGYDLNNSWALKAIPNDCTQLYVRPI